MTPLKLSQFTVPIEHYPSQGQHLLYNTLTRSMIQVDDDCWSSLQRLDQLSLDATHQDSMKALAKQGFVVPKDANEGELYTQRLSQAKNNTDQLNVTLSLVQNCNFGCSYCYQGGNSTTHDGSKITQEGIEGSINTSEIIRFLQSQCQERKVKTLGFTAYGGEPLLNKPALIEIASTMQAYCKQNGIRWGFSMVSNGSLLTKKTVLQLKEYGFASVQVTIDGNKETHDQSRPWKSEKGKGISTYDIVMHNLDRWAGLIYTDVLCVVSMENISAAYELVDTLAENGYANKKVRIGFSPISPTYDEANLSDVRQLYLEQPSLIEEELAIDHEITKLMIYAAQHGLIDDLRPRPSWCSVIRANGQNLTITPDGKIYSCALFIGREEKYETGHINTEERGGLDAMMQAYEYPDQCKKCTYLPICANCRADALSKTDDLFGANSQEARYEKSLPQLIKAQYNLMSQ